MFKLTKKLWFFLENNFTYRKSSIFNITLLINFELIETIIRQVICRKIDIVKVDIVKTKFIKVSNFLIRHRID